MTVRRMKEFVVTDLCERYGVTTLQVDSVPRRFEGPMGHGCNPKKRLVYFETGNWLCQEIEMYFHELVHVITQPPWWTIKQTPEEIMLFQFERALANATMEDWAYDRVVDWQHMTAVTISGRYPGDLCLGDLKPYEDEPFWKLGYAICHRVGLLNAKGRPTYQWPDWSRIEPQKDAILRYYQTRAKTPLPVF